VTGYLLRNALLGNFEAVGAFLARFCDCEQCASRDEKRRIQLDTVSAFSPSLLARPSANKEAASAKKPYKSVPETHRVLSEAKFHKVVSDLEAILLDISTDGVGINTPDGRISALTLKSWAESLRDALETLSKAQ
jgi:hypothetical protein